MRGIIDALFLLDTGFCRAREASLIQGGANKTVDCHALVALIHHSREGWLLFDTGYNTERLAQATARLPFRAYRQLLPAYSRPEQSVVCQIARFGLSPGDIRHIIVSHFHPDHAGGLCDFPQARFVCDRAAWDDTQARTGFAALRQGLLPALLPNDFAERAQFCDDYSDGTNLPGLGKTRDVFGDQSLLLVPLPGHARGQIGLFIPQSPRGPVFLVADGAYLMRSIRENKPPGAITNLFADDSKAVVQTVSRLHEFHQARPDVALVPTHCAEAFARVAEWGKM